MKRTLRHIAKASLLLLLFMSLAPQKASAQFGYYEIRGMMIYHFGRFVTWPERVFSGENKIVLGILGDDPFGASIDNILRNRRIRGRTWEVRRSNELSDLQGSHIIFITQSKKGEVKEILEELNSNKYRRAHILTIGDNIENFCRYGGVLNIDRNNFFTINSDAANNANLIIDSRLWQMAKAIESYENR